MITDQKPFLNSYETYIFFTSLPDYNLLPFGKQWCVISQLDLERRLLNKGSFQEVHNLLTEVSNFSLSCCKEHKCGILKQQHEIKWLWPEL